MKLKIAELIAFSFWFMLLSSQAVTTVGVGDGAEQIPEETRTNETPSLAKIATDTISTIRNPHRISWHKIKTLLNKLQLRLSPPNLEGSSNEADAVEEVKDAVEESLGSGKSTVEGSARSAAEAVHVTAEKVKESMSDEGSRSEL